MGNKEINVGFDGYCLQDDIEYFGELLFKAEENKDETAVRRYEQVLNRLCCSDSEVETTKVLKIGGKKNGKRK